MKISFFLIILVFLVSGCVNQTIENVDATHQTGPTSNADLNVVEVSVSARQFEFDPSTIEVSEGDLVKLHITSEDVSHGFSLPEFNVNANLPPGKTVDIEFVADKKGTFPFACSVFCGSGHGSMKGTLVVN